MSDNRPSGLFGDALQWSRGRWWQWRVPVLLLLAWDGWRHFRDPEQGGLFAGITFGSHELGHLLFAFFGEFMTVLGGSLTQILIPLGAGCLLYYNRDYFGISAAGAWLTSSLLDLARYVGDARAMELDLVGFGEDPQHDWAWLLGHLDLLDYDTRIAAWTRGLALIVLVGSLLFGLWLCMNMRPAGTETRAGTAS
jgi:hypothetical protein